MLVLMIIGVLPMVPTVGEVVFRPNRNGIVWLARFLYLGYGTAGQIFRLLLANITAVVAGLIWTYIVSHLNTDSTMANSLYRTRSSVPWAHYEH
jgi:putative flippase GtrA